jgi:hypothetical protein
MPKVEINYQLDFFLYLFDKNVQVDFICLDNNIAHNFTRAKELLSMAPSQMPLRCRMIFLLFKFYLTNSVYILLLN